MIMQMEVLAWVWGQKTDVKSWNKVTEFYFISRPASERAGVLTVNVHHSDRCGHNNASSHYNPTVSGGEKKRQTHCSTKETKMQGEEKLRGKKCWPTFLLQHAMGQQFETQPDHLT